MMQLQQRLLPEVPPTWPIWNMAVESVAELEERLIVLSDRVDAIKTLCDTENRDLSPEEVTEVDSLLNEFQGIRHRLTARQKLGAAVDQVHGSLGRKSTPEGPGGRGGRAEGIGTIVGEDQQTGRAIRAYGPTEKIAEWQGLRQEFTFQQWIRAVYSGDRSSLPVNTAMVEQEGGAGGFLVPPALSANIVELMRNQAMVIKAGAMTIPMNTSAISFARQASDVTAYWRGELKAITPSAAVVEQVNMRAYSLAALTVCSEELLMDSPNAGAVIEQSLAQSLALALDLSAISGNGAGQPLGILNTTGVQTLSVVGAPVDYTAFSQAIGKLWAANYQPTAALYNGLTASVFDAMQNAMLQTVVPPPSWNTYAHLVTNQLVQTGNTSPAILGDFSRYWYGMRSQIVVSIERTGSVVDGSTTHNLLQDLGVAIRAWLRADGLAVQPSAFCILPGIVSS